MILGKLRKTNKEKTFKAKNHKSRLYNFLKDEVLDIKRWSKNLLKKFSLFIDQLLHILVIVGFVVIIYSDDKCKGIPWGSAKDTLLIFYYNYLNFKPHDFIRLIFASLLILRPANIIIKELNPHPLSDFSSAFSVKPAGRYIGTLERIIVFVFVIVQQYSAIGFVFAAKTLTRFNKISEDQDFAEYYLIGTLLSLLIALAAGLLVAQMFISPLQSLKI